MNKLDRIVKSLYEEGRITADELIAITGSLRVVANMPAAKERLVEKFGTIATDGLNSLLLTGEGSAAPHVELFSRVFNEPHFILNLVVNGRPEVFEIMKFLSAPEFRQLPDRVAALEAVKQLLRDNGHGYMLMRPVMSE